MNFEQKLAFGRVGEEKIANWLINRCGASVLPVYQIDSDDKKGPRLFAQQCNLTVPDLLVWSKSNGLIWMEAKRKTVFSWYRKTETWQTGIDKHLFEQYKKVATKTKLPIWLLFLHEKESLPKRDEPWPCPIGLFGQTLEMLSGSIDHPHGKMLYWREASLKKIAELSEL